MNPLICPRPGLFYDWTAVARLLAFMVGTVLIVAIAILAVGGAVILWRRMMTREDQRERGVVQDGNRFEDRLRALECRTAIPHHEEE